MRTTELILKLQAYGADVDGMVERFMDDAELYADCYEKFVTDKHFARLAEGIAEKDYATAFVSAHTLKGLAGNMGLTPMYDAICVVVEALRKEKYDDLDAQYAAVLADLAVLRSFV